MKIAIIGFGIVGQAVYHVFKNKDKVVVYDKYISQFNSVEKISGSDFIFICLPTPNNNENVQDASNLHEVFIEIEKLKRNEKNWNPTIVIKSTVLFSQIEKFINSFPVVLNPEFLSQNSSFKDSENQDVIILGGRIDQVEPVIDLYKNETNLEASFEIMLHEEAIQFKYIRNIYGAYKVLFWNWVQEQTGNARKYAYLYSKVPQGEMSQVASDGKLGFGGGCFKKDVDAYHSEFEHELTEFIKKYNNKLRPD